MKRIPLALLAAALSFFAPRPAFCLPATVEPGVWVGHLALAPASGQGGVSASIRLKLFSDPTKGQQSGLIDIPELSMFGYPLDTISWTDSSLHFVLDAPGTGQELDFEGKTGAASPNSADTISGKVKSPSFTGDFSLNSVEEPAYPGESRLLVPSGDAKLPGTLLVPSNKVGALPLVVLLQGAGPADRDGNNYNVPGKCDSLLQLARALAGRGVASFRFDKRGTGESYRLESPAMATAFGTYVDDAISVVNFLGKMDGFSRVLVAGMNEGAWIGAAAAGGAGGRRAPTLARPVDGLVALDASGSSPMEQLDASLANLDAATRKEAEAIVAALLAGRTYPQPSATLADFFAPRRSAWLSGWLAFDPLAAFKAAETAVLFVRGASDMQVSPADFEKLIDSRPQSPARSIPEMNYALKVVKNEQENFDSFTDPKYLVSPILVDLLAAFAKVEPAPASALAYVRGGK